MVQIYATNRREFTLGRRGENLAAQVVFDLSGWVGQYGPGVAELIYQRPGDAAPYPVAAVREGDTLLWTPTATDTAKESTIAVGSGHCELRWYVGNILAKSQMWRVWVEEAMDTPSETVPPEPQQGWVDQVLTVGVEVRNAVAAAGNSADAAGKSANEAALSADMAAQSAESAALSAQQAEENAAKYADMADDVNQLKEELADKLPKSPSNWEQWTAEEQAVARERMGVPGDYELVADITVAENVGYVVLGNITSEDLMVIVSSDAAFGMTPYLRTANNDIIYVGLNSIYYAIVKISKSHCESTYRSSPYTHDPCNVLSAMIQNPINGTLRLIANGANNPITAGTTIKVYAR